MRVLVLPLLIVFLSGQFAFSKSIRVFGGQEDYPPYDIRVSSAVYGTINFAVFGSLLRSNDVYEISPSLVKKWKYDHQAKKYQLTLSDAKFHNGRPINSKDLEFSLVRGFVSKQENYHRIYLSEIQGSEKLKPGMPYRSGMLSGLKLIDEKTIEIKLKSINPVFLLRLTTPLIPLVPREELKDDLYTWKKLPIGAGPYRVEKDFLSKSMELTRVLGEGSEPERIVFDTEIKRTQYDLIFDRSNDGVPAELKKIFSKNPTSVSALFFYRDNPLGENPNFRKAIYYALNRVAICEGFDQFRPAYGLLVPPYAFRKHESNDYDPELAKKHLKKVSPELLKKLIVIGVYTDRVIHPALQIRIDRIVENLKSIGLNVKFEPITEMFPNDKIIKRYTMKMWLKNVDLLDPSMVFASMTSFSPFGVELPETHGEFDRLYHSIVSQKSMVDRFNKIKNLENYIEREFLVIPVLQRYSMYLIRSEVISDLGNQTNPLFMDFSLIR